MRSESIAIKRMRRFLNLGEKQVLKISLASASKFSVLRQCRPGRLHHDATAFGFHVVLVVKNPPVYSGDL